MPVTKCNACRQNYFVFFSFPIDLAVGSFASFYCLCLPVHSHRSWQSTFQIVLEPHSQSLVAHARCHPNRADPSYWPIPPRRLVLRQWPLSQWHVLVAANSMSMSLSLQVLCLCIQHQHCHICLFMARKASVTAMSSMSPSSRCVSSRIPAVSTI